MINKEIQKMQEVFNYFKVEADIVCPWGMSMDSNGSEDNSEPISITYLVPPKDYLGIIDGSSKLGIGILAGVGININPDNIDSAVRDSVFRKDLDINVKKDIFYLLETIQERRFGFLQARLYCAGESLCHFEGERIFGVNFIGDRIVEERTEKYGMDELELTRQYKSKIEALVKGTDARKAVDLAFEIYDSHDKF